MKDRSSSLRLVQSQELPQQPRERWEPGFEAYRRAHPEQTWAVARLREALKAALSPPEQQLALPLEPPLSPVGKPSTPEPQP